MRTMNFGPSVITKGLIHSLLKTTTLLNDAVELLLVVECVFVFVYIDLLAGNLFLVVFELTIFYSSNLVFQRLLCRLFIVITCF